MSSLAELPELVGFFSYSREDDEAFKGMLSALRDGIQRELSAQLGRTKRTFRLWQDLVAIAPGKLWESEIKTAIDGSFFFIPIVTPRSVSSKYCKFEFDSFLAREKAIGRSDLVFPILYISVAALENEAKWRDDVVLSTIGRRQYVDWRPLRHLDVQTTTVREQIERLCQKIVEALNEPWVPPEERRRMEEAEARQRAEEEARRLEAEAKRRAEEEQHRKQEEAKARQRAEEERRRQKAEAKRLADEEERRKRAEAEARQRAEQERVRTAAEAPDGGSAEAGRWRVRAAIGAAAVAVLLLAGWAGYAFIQHMLTTVEQTVQQRLTAVKVEQERQARAAAEAEEKRKAEEAEQQRLAAVKAEQERQARAAAEAEEKRKAEEAEQLRLVAAAAGTSTTASLRNWLMPTGDYANRRYSELKQITAENVGELQVAWTFSTGVLRGHEGGPLVVDNVMYVHTPYPNMVYALDLSQDGKILWKYEPIQDWQRVIPKMCCDTVNRGPSYADGKIFLHRADTMLVALDAKTGKVVWSVKNGDPEKGETGTSSPMVFKDKVIVGVSGGEFGVRGFVTAYNIKDGKRVWRAYSMGPDSDTLLDPERTTNLGTPVGPNSGMNTWQDEQWKIGGGTTWGWYSYDPELNLFYYGSGNPSTWNAKQRPGDNRWSTTIFARDVDTGQARWVYQMTPHDEWAYDGVNEMILADQNIGGRTRRTLVHFDRNGFAYVLDRTNGELLLAEKYDSAVNWATKIDIDRNSSSYGRPVKALAYSPESNGEDVNTKGICPSWMGTKNQQPAAFSPKTGLFYVPTTHLCMDYEPFRVRYSKGQPYVGASPKMYTPSGETNLGNFIAWDARSGKIVWSTKEQFAVWSGALATAGDVVFYGTLEGDLKAVDARNGKELYRFKTVSGIIGNVITYEHGGRQYVAVLSGIGGLPGIGLAAGLSDPSAGLGAVGAFAALGNYTSLGGQLTVFALPK